MPRKPTYGVQKRIASISMPSGMYEFFRRYSGRENNASGGISTAILTLVTNHKGAGYIMAQVALSRQDDPDGVAAPDDLVEAAIERSGDAAAKDKARELRETGFEYEAQLKERAYDSRIVTLDDDSLKRPVGAPLLYEEPSEKYAITLTPGEAEFLDRLGTGKRPRSQGIRSLFINLMMIDPEAARMVCEIWDEGNFFIPQLYVDIADCEAG